MEIKSTRAGTSPRLIFISTDTTLCIDKHFEKNFIEKGIYFQQHIVRSSGQISWVRPRPTWRRFQETNQGSHQIQQPGRSRGRGTPSNLEKQLWHVCYLSLDRCVWGGHPYTHKTDFIPIGGIFCQWQHLLILARYQHNESLDGKESPVCIPWSNMASNIQICWKLLLGFQLAGGYWRMNETTWKVKVHIIIINGQNLPTNDTRVQT